MAPSSSSSKSTSSPPSTPHHCPPFTPIQECDREEQEDATPTPGETTKPYQHQPTPLHDKETQNCKNKRQESGEYRQDGSVSCNKCRPHSREKISVVPLDTNNGACSKNSSISMASPNGIFKSIFSSLTRKSPKSPQASSSREEQWKIAFAELSHKLIQATRKRDEAVLEASRLKYSMAELEKKLNKLEVYCHNLRLGLDECSGNSPYQAARISNVCSSVLHVSTNEKVIQQFLVSVSEARTCVRLVSRALSMQLRHMGTRVFDRISVLLQPYDIRISFSKNPKNVQLYLEALLNKAFFEDFESIGFQKSSVHQILNPIDRCEANYASFNVLKDLTWEEVFSHGTKHFSEEFSKFCDRKMNEIVAMLGWNRAWPEPILQAFFGASKCVWLVHLLANSVHPGLPIFRVDKGVRFESIYMEDMGGDRVRKLVPTVVRIMVAPGFYIYGSVIKCKVLCRYHNNSNHHDSSFSDKGVDPSP